METIKASISIDMKVAISKGIDTHGDHEVEVKPSMLTEAQRQELAKCRRQIGSKAINITDAVTEGDFNAEIGLQQVDLGDLARAVPQILDQRIELRNRQIKKIDQILTQAWDVLKDAPAESFWKQTDTVPGHYNRPCLKEYPAFVRIYPYSENLYKELRQYCATENTENKLLNLAKIRNHTEILKRLEIIRGYAAERNQIAVAKLVEREKELAKQREREQQARKQEEEARKQEEERLAAEKAERRQRSASAWIAEHGSESMRERWAESFLPESEIKDAMREWLFKGLSDLPRYQKLTKTDVCECEYGEGDVEFDVRTAKALPESAYAVLKQIRNAFKEPPAGAVVTITPQEHVAVCNDCNQTLSRLSVRVEICFAEYLFSRQYAA